MFVLKRDILHRLLFDDEGCVDLKDGRLALWDSAIFMVVIYPHVDI